MATKQLVTTDALTVHWIGVWRVYLAYWYVTGGKGYEFTNHGH